MKNLNYLLGDDYTPPKVKTHFIDLRVFLKRSFHWCNVKEHLLIAIVEAVPRNAKPEVKTRELNRYFLDFHSYEKVLSRTRTKELLWLIECVQNSPEYQKDRAQT